MNASVQTWQKDSTTGDAQPQKQTSNAAHVTLIDAVTGIAYNGSQDYQARIALGRVPGITRVAAIGLVTIVATGDVPTDIVSFATAAAKLYPLMNAATSLEILSSSAADTSAGAGMQRATISGLDASYNSITSTVSMNGVTPVAIPTQFLRINNVAGSLITPGSGSSRINNVGLITVRDAGGGATRAQLPIGTGGVQQAVYTVPAGFTLLIDNIELQVTSSAGGTTRGADAVLLIRNSTGFVTSRRKLSTTDVNPTVLMAQTKILIPEKFDFIIQCTYISNNNMTVGAAWEGDLYSNTIV